MKILYIAPDITDSGGISRVVSLKANYLVTTFNYEISILSVNNCSSIRFYDFNPRIKWFNLKESDSKLLFLINYIKFIKQTISQEKPNVIVVCDAVLWLFIPWFLKTKIPIVFETHFSIHFRKSKIDSILIKLRYNLVRFFKQITINKFTCFVTLTAEENIRRKSKKGIVIPNPLSFIANSPADLINKKAMAVCMTPYVKGLDRLLIIWSKIIEKYPEWVLDIYGKWDVDTSFIKIANDLNILKNVNFLSKTKSIQSAYLQSSIFLMTSRHEAFGMVLIESMACGLPCIAYDCPTGPRSIIQKDMNGFLIEDGDSDAFVKKMAILISNEKIRKEMGKKAKRSVEKYEINLIMKKWDKLFRDLIRNS